MAPSQSPTSIAPAYYRQPYLLRVDEVLDQLDTNTDAGLAASKAEQYLQKYGENKLDGDGGVSWYRVLLKQMSNAMILVLILAMALSFGVQDWLEGGVITAVILLNLTIGFVQEYRAEQTMESLRSLSSPTAAVLRDGNIHPIPSGKVVPGDIVELKTGDTVPADLRLFETMNLEADEALLTGEALPVAKNVEVSNTEDLGIGDRKNIAYSSSVVTKGRARGIVISTGMHTEIGKIAASLKGMKKKPSRSMSRKKYGTLQPLKGALLRTKDSTGRFLGITEGTPLQRKLSKLAYVLLVCALILAVIVFGVNRFNVTNEVAIYAISLGIAIIPESLPAVLTIVMALGMKTMSKRSVIVRKLDSLESLGGITNICSDKTGTLTQGKMVTRKAWIPGVGIYTVKGCEEALNPTSGHVMLIKDSQNEADRRKRDEERSALTLKFDAGTKQGENKITNDDGIKNGLTEQDVVPELEAFLHSTALCNLSIIRLANGNRWKATGDPTEIALQVFSHRFKGYGKQNLLGAGWNQLGEYPFDSDIKRMTVAFQAPSDMSVHIFTKGAVERVLELCTTVGFGKSETELTEEGKVGVLEQMSALADQGLRVLAIARRTFTDEVENWAEYPRGNVETGLSLIGLAGLYDPPRLETAQSVRECTEAGIKVHMLTGDHPGTARAIAKEVGILPTNMAMLPLEVADSLVKTASEFDKLTDAEIDAMPELPLVIARCAPDTKVRMIDALHRRSLFVAMTGDGVNDSPSLKAADVGIGMGLAGSDVAKSASSIVLADDNFASIVGAIEEGRRMFDNIQKFTLHLLTSNVGEVILLIVGLAFQDTQGLSVFPLAPLGILWINMLTSSFPAFGLGLEKKARDIMNRPPHDSKKGIFTWEIMVDMIVYGTLMGSLTLITFVVIVYGVGNGELGHDCNRSYSDSCDTVFRARAAVFAELTWLILLSAWEFKSIRRSIFRLNPDSESKFPLFHDLWDNKFLFFAVVIGFVSVFPVVYIPVLNTSVFKHKGITWEWGLSFGAIVIFISGIELWKMTKRAFGLFRIISSGETGLDEKSPRGLQLRQGIYSMRRTFSKTRSSMADTEVVSLGREVIEAREQV